MPPGRKRGRRKRPRTTAEKLLLAEFSQKLVAKMEAEDWDAKRTARELGISLASFYNYKKKNDLPRYEVLKRAHDFWGWNFKHIDFSERSARAPSETEEPRQYVLPFIQNVRESYRQVIG